MKGFFSKKVNLSKKQTNKANLSLRIKVVNKKLERPRWEICCGLSIGTWATSIPKAANRRRWF